MFMVHVKFTCDALLDSRVGTETLTFEETEFKFMIQMCNRGIQFPNRYRILAENMSIFERIARSSRYRPRSQIMDWF